MWHIITQVTMQREDTDVQTRQVSELIARTQTMSVNTSDPSTGKNFLTPESKEKTVQTFDVHRALLKQYTNLQTLPTPFRPTDVQQAVRRLASIGMVIIQSKNDAFPTSAEWSTAISNWVERKHKHANVPIVIVPGIDVSVKSRLVLSDVYTTLLKFVYAQTSPLVARDLVNTTNTNTPLFLRRGFTTQLTGIDDLSELYKEKYTYMGVCVLSGLVRVTLDPGFVDVSSGCTVVWRVSASQDTMRFETLSVEPAWLYHFAYCNSSETRELYPGLIQTQPVISPIGMSLDIRSYYSSKPVQSVAPRATTLPLALL